MQFTGRAEIRIGGILYPTLDGAKLTNPMGESRKPVKGARNYGYTVGAETPMIEAEFPMSSDITLAQLWAVTDQTITFECDDGTVFAMVNGTMSEISDLTAAEQAKVSIKIMGTDCQQQ
jgi:hypothetical protein